MRCQKLLPQRLGVILIMVITLSLIGCGTQQPEHASEAPADRAASTDPNGLWVDATKTTIGVTTGWTNRVELADINGDELVDVLFANGGDYDTPGKPDFSQVFLNQGPGQMFEGATRQVFGPTAMLARVIKVMDVNRDGSPDILVGTTYQTQSQLYLGDGSGNFTNVTRTHLPKIKASIGDLEFGDVDGDEDLDVVLADWGPGSPMANEGGRTMLWLNDGSGHFTNATGARMPDVLVKFSWELEFVDVDNDYDLDILVSCKVCDGSFLFENDGTGAFTDVTTQQKLPQFYNNYDFEAMDVDGDDYLDVVTINDGGPYLKEHVFLNDGQGGFRNETARLWPGSQNVGKDDAIAAFLDFDSDGDADLLIGSLDGPDRLLLNDGSGKLKLVNHTEPILGDTPGTLDIALADLNSDRKLDVVQAQGETYSSFEEKVFWGKKVQVDTAPPVISQVERISASGADRPIQIRARVHDNKSRTMPHEWRSVVLRWSADGQTQKTPMQWYGEYLWRGTIDEPPAGVFSYEVCATDAAGNEACASPRPWWRFWG
jgi:hypothetical protein